MRRRPFRTARLGLLVLLALSLALTGMTTTSPATPRSPLEEPAAVRTVRLLFPGGAELDAAVSAGFDLGHDVARVPNGLEIDAVVTAADLVALEGFGARELAPSEVFDWTRAAEEGRRAATTFAPTSAALAPPDSVRLGRIDYFDTKGQGFISVEAKTTAGNDATARLLLLWDAGPGTPMGAGGAAVMTAFVDSGEYLYHELLTPVQARPEQFQVISTHTGTATGFVSDWLYPVEPLLDQQDYAYSFVDDYMDPTALFARVDELAAAYPDIAEIEYLDHETNGYRRKAQATIGSNDSAVVVTSTRWGHEGGNDVTVEFVSAEAEPLDVEIEGSAVRVHVAATTTAAEVIGALNEHADEVVTAHTYRGSAGSGPVSPTGPIALTDFLQAPDSVLRDPYPVRALRIGKHRDGSQTGVLIIAQDHAREWVPPLVAIEAAERVLANYATDPETRRIVDSTEIWIVPSNNPDGSHYSFHDFASQRRSMTNHCAENNSDPGRRNSWGVDLNRNYRVGSVYDGYSGGSTSCTSNTFAGPDELSEPESQNVVGLVEEHPNIKFFMTIHSNGGQLFWQPGAYIAEGRVTTPRPELRDEAYYWQMAERILSHVKTYQDTVVRPDNVGGSSDVLYSSAGNVREDLYFNYGIYAMGWEVGGRTWDATTRTWVSGSFQPAWERGYGEAMEYANGVVEMFRIAADFGDDIAAPTTELLPGEGSYSEAVDVMFESSEPAAVYYTTDGSAPTFESSRYQAIAMREGGETLTVTATTTFKWFSVDPAGNVEGGYDPATGTGYREATITITS